MSSVFCVEPLKPSENDGSCGGIWGIWGGGGGGGDCGRGKWTSSLAGSCTLLSLLYLISFVVSSLNMIKTCDIISFDSVDWGYLQVQWQPLWIVKLATPSCQQFMEPVIHVCWWLLLQMATFWWLLSPGTANYKSKIFQTEDRILSWDIFCCPIKV